MALSNKRILEEKRKGDIVISPFRMAQLQTSSYDVTLGPNYYRARKPKHDERLHNMYDPAHVARKHGEACFAKTAKKVFGDRLKTLKFIEPTDRVIVLEPGDFILAHTIEFIGGRGHITTSMQARSSMGRSEITVCKCAGWGDVGFFNRWTMEIENCSKERTVFLVVGEPIAQIIFDETGAIIDDGKDYVKAGNYQSSQDLKVLKKMWHPSMMLPKLRLKRYGKRK